MSLQSAEEIPDFCREIKVIQRHVDDFTDDFTDDSYKAVLFEVCRVMLYVWI